MTSTRPATNQEIQTARDAFERVSVRIDPEMRVQPVEGGVWVGAWVFVADADADEQE